MKGKTMNDLSVLASVGVFVAVISFLSYKLGQAQEGNKHAEKESGAVEEAKRIRERLNNDADLQKEVKERFSR
ncbi:MAG: hypothetical protein KH349_06765 [Clostridium sp.]|nr:hypothetical protein [Clostridium sp.]